VAASDSAKFCVISSAVIGAVVVLEKPSVAVLDENLVDAVLGLLATFTQT